MNLHPSDSAASYMSIGMEGTTRDPSTLVPKPAGEPTEDLNEDPADAEDRPRAREPGSLDLTNFEPELLRKMSSTQVERIDATVGVDSIEGTFVDLDPTYSPPDHATSSDSTVDCDATVGVDSIEGTFVDLDPTYSPPDHDTSSDSTVDCDVSSVTTVVGDVISSNTTIVGEVVSSDTTVVGEVVSSDTAVVGDIASSDTAVVGDVEKKKSRKRSRNPDTWKRNIKKKKNYFTHYQLIDY
ncbi:hypothetical protein LSTR_LSTR001649 [Laodelphax striatellus]|uniref:Uncharacterized protein n=1 Tax=Laodelphax striatellus TaxID=195883 RepID=A0A482XD28_LAOST|nr:hypothetical protein LSTR_LSTR001649 [Laodelphax striatellus]